jgi:uncharacterized phage-associated protein
MHFPLKVNKAIQAIGVLFRQDRVNRMNSMRLLKLLYVADRESLKERGRPITGGPMVAMERGPVLEEVYDLIRGQHVEMLVWDEYLRQARYDLELLKDPDVRQLSRYEIAKLQEVAQRYAEDDEWALSRHTHGFAEWQKHDPGKSCRPIPLDDLLEAVGRGEVAAKIKEEAHDAAAFDRIFGE